jgi:hypothetical protein
LLLRAFAAGLLVVVLGAALFDVHFPMSDSLWLTQGGSIATDGATDGGAGKMSIDGVSAGDAAGWRASWAPSAAVLD